MTDTFNEGDLIEATKGESVIRGRVIRPGTTDRLALSVFEATPDRAPFIQWLDSHGWTFRTIEKAAPALPTEPGWYLARPGSSNYAHLQLCFDNDCKDSKYGPHWYRPDQHRVIDASEVAEHYHPLARLEPVADTAKKVAEFVLNWIDEAEIYTHPQLRAAVATEFGVTL